MLLLILTAPMCSPCTIFTSCQSSPARIQPWVSLLTVGGSAALPSQRAANRIALLIFRVRWEVSSTAPATSSPIRSCRLLLDSPLRLPKRAATRLLTWYRVPPGPTSTLLLLGLPSCNPGRTVCHRAVCQQGVCLSAIPRLLSETARPPLATRGAISSVDRFRRALISRCRSRPSSPSAST